MDRLSRSACRLLAVQHHVEDRCLAAFRGGKRFLQGGSQIGELFDPPAVEAEMAADLLIIRAIDRDTVMEILAARNAIGIVMHVTLSHCFVFFVVEYDDDDGHLVPLRRAQSLDDGIVKERAVPDEQGYRPLSRRKLDSERRPYPLAKSA